MRKKSYFYRLPPILLLMLIFIAGCDIQETEQAPSGDVFINAVDSAENELIGGKIFLNGLETGQLTPDTVKNIPIGEHSIRVKVHGYVAAEDSVTVFDDQIAFIEFILTPADWGILAVNSVPLGAEIILDRGSTGLVTPQSAMQVETGLHTVSVFLESYATINPWLDSLIVHPEDTASIDFILEAGTLGGYTGQIAYDFTLNDDFGSLVSLRDYRGYITLLTFFFSDCQPCMNEFPQINQAYLDYAQYGVQVLGLDPMFYDTIEDVIAVRQNLNISFKLLIDEGAVYNQMYEVIAYPTNIVVSPSGEIYTRMYGTSYDELAEIFDEILGLP